MLSGVPALARAADLELYDGTSCASLDELSFRVSRALGQSLEAVGERRFRVDLRRDARGFHARLSTSGSRPASAPSLRELNATSCDEIVDALALALAIALASSSDMAAGGAAPVGPPPAAISAQPDVPAANAETPTTSAPTRAICRPSRRSRR
jgi:hypothetical protein